MAPNDNRPQNWPNQQDRADELQPQDDSQFSAAPAWERQPFVPNPSQESASPPSDGYGGQFEPSDRPGLAGQSFSDQSLPQAESQPTPPVFTPTSPVTGSQFGQFQSQPFSSSDSFVQKKKFWTKRKKIVFGLLSAFLVLLLAGGGAAFAYYHDSSKVVGDALSKAVLADSSQIKGDASVSGDADGVQASIELDYDFKSNEQASQTDVALDINVPPMSIDMAGSTIFDNQGNHYFKVENAKQIIQNILGGFGGGSSVDPEIDGMNSLVEMVDNKWIKVSKEDLLESSTKEERESFECSTKLMRDLTRDKGLLKEVADVYRSNSFINTEQLKSDDFSVLHYKLTLDEQKAKDFAKSFQGTRLHERNKECDKEFKIDERDVSEAVKDINKASVEVWIHRWSHEFTKLTVSGKSEEATYKLTANTTFNQPVTIDIPQNATPFKKLVEEIEKIFGGMFGAAYDDYLPEEEAADDDLYTSNGEVNPLVLGTRSFRLLPW